MWNMMLRSNRSLTDTRGGAIKRKMSRSKKVKDVHIGGKSTEEQVSSVAHSGTSLASSTSDCTSNVEQMSSMPEHSAVFQIKSSKSTEVGKCGRSVIPSSTTSSQVLPDSNQSAELQPSCVSQDCPVVPGRKSSSQMLANSTQTADLLPSSVSEDSVRSLEMEDSIVEVIPTEISDVSVLEIKSCEQSSNDKKSADGDTSDIIIISDSPEKGSVGKATLKTTSHEVSHLQQGRKRKLSEESGVEILCDISGPRPKKQQKIECAIKDKKLRTNNSVKKKFTVAVSDTNRKISQLTKNEKIEDVNIASKQGSVDKDDVIVIGADDDEVSVINTEKEDKPPEEDVIILDSPPAQSSTDKKPKKSVSASVTGLIPHYTRHLIDYIPLDGRPPASSSSSSTSTPQLPAGNRDRTVTHEHIPVLRRRDPNDRRPHRYQRAALRNRVNAPNYNCTVQSDCIPVPLCTSIPPALAENHNSPVRNSTQNSTVPNPTAQNSTAQNSTAQNSTAQNCAAQNSTAQNCAAQNSTAQNCAAQNTTTQNSTVQNAVPENSVQSAPEVSQSPACPYGSNIYNPNSGDKEEIGLRPVILDGNSVAMGHGKGKFFSWRGLHICIKFFLKRGHNVTAFVPTFRRGVCPPELRSEMDEFERSGQVVFTPSRRIEGRLIVPYDDRFIVQAAAELGGVIVSTDNFRDLLTENNSWKETIEKRLLMFTWVGDLLMFPHDPLGRHGPQLEEFLRFPKK